jgi:phage terminase Nu1 subunit (DNA packaging protein)
MASQPTMARHLFLSSGRVQNLQYQGILTKGADLDVAREQYIMFLRGLATEAQRGGSGDVNEERARLIHHQANLASLEEDVKQGKLIPADEIEKEWVDMSMAMRAKMIALPKKVAAVGCGINEYVEMEALVKGFVNEALDELSVNDEIQEHP